MIKTAAIFPAQAARNSVPVLAAMQQSLERAGVRIEINGRDSDAAVIWSVLWAGRMAANRDIYQHYRAQGRKVIIADVGSLKRGVTWKIALDNINADGWFGDGDFDSDRPAKLGIARSPVTGGSQILIAAQHRSSLQAQDIGCMAQWVQGKVREIRRYSDRPIVIRPHPRDRLETHALDRGVTVQTPRKIPGTYDDFDWSHQWHAVVNHNSGPGVLAGLAGVRPVVDRTSLAWPVAVNIQDIEQPYAVDRSKWLVEIAHTEYTLEEIAQGLWLKRLSSRL